MPQALLADSLVFDMPDICQSRTLYSNSSTRTHAHIHTRAGTWAEIWSRVACSHAASGFSSDGNPRGQTGSESHIKITLANRHQCLCIKFMSSAVFKLRCSVQLEYAFLVHSCTLSSPLSFFTVRCTAAVVQWWTLVPSSPVTYVFAQQKSYCRKVHTVVSRGSPWLISAFFAAKLKFQYSDDNVPLSSLTTLGQLYLLNQCCKYNLTLIEMFSIEDPESLTNFSAHILAGRRPKCKTQNWRWLKKQTLY